MGRLDFAVTSAGKWWRKFVIEFNIS